MFKFIKQSVLPWSQAGTQIQAKELQPLYMGRLNLQPAKLQFSSNNMSICHKNNLKLDFFKQIARSGSLALKSLSKDLQTHYPIYEWKNKSCFFPIILGEQLHSLRCEILQFLLISAHLSGLALESVLKSLQKD